MYYIRKIVVSLCVVLIAFTLCSGQFSWTFQAVTLLESRSMSKGQPKLVKTQGSTTADNVHCILEDNTGNIWFGTTGEGVYRYDGKLFTQFTKNDGLSSNGVYSMMEDKEGNVWFGTEHGVCRYDGTTITSMPFITTFSYGLYPNTSSEHNTSVENTVCAILQDKNGTIWFGATDGVYRYNGRSFSRFLDDRKILNGQNLQLKRIQCLLEDNNGTIWMGSGPIAMEGVIRFDGTSIASVKPNGDGWIRTMVKDKIGKIWFGGRGRGNFTYNKKDFANFTEKTGIGNPILVDRAGNIWFGGDEKLSTVESDGGIWSYDGKAFRNYNNKDGMNNYAVFSMLQDKNGDVWVGTRNTGLYKFDGKTFTNFSE